MEGKELEQSILSAINLTPESLDKGVECIIDWILKQPHLPDLKDREIIKTFIVGSKSIERAKEKIDKYYSVRAKYPLYFANRDPKLIRWPALEKVVKLPGLTPTGHLVYLILPPTKEEDVKVFDYVHTMQFFFMALDRVFQTDPVVSGHYLVFDCKDLGVEFVMKCISTQLPVTYNIYQGSLPVRLKGLILFNAFSAAEFLADKIFRIFLNEKLRQRVVVHAEDHTVLSKYFPLEMLPSDYGGLAPSVLQLWDGIKKDLDNHRDWFLNEGTEKCDESKRTKPGYDGENIQGTFRKLQTP